VEAVVWSVLWVAFAFFGSWAIYAVLALGGVFIAALIGRAWPAVVFIALAWIAAIGWFIFAAIQAVLQIIATIQLAVAGG